MHWRDPEISEYMVVEKSPLSRFMRFNQKLSAGLNKQVHLGQDSDNGKEVVWMVIRLHGMDTSAKTHNTYDAWIGTGLNRLCFITERV